jgi:hypothetical protein
MLVANGSFSGMFPARPLPEGTPFGTLFNTSAGDSMFFNITTLNPTGCDFMLMKYA